MMNMTNKQKASVATALAVGVIATQGYLLVDNKKELNLANQKISKQVLDIKDLSSDNATLMRHNDEAELKINELETEITEKNETITNLESEKVRLNAEVKKLKSSAYPTSVSRSSSRGGTPITMTLTFYGGGAEENGGYAGMNAYSGKLTPGTVASNVYPRGTKFRLPNGQVLTVNDKGGSHFDSYSRLDVYVPKLPGEDKHEYDKRISNYGRKTLTVYKL